jgi:hypothetical protein
MRDGLPGYACDPFRDRRSGRLLQPHHVFDGVERVFGTRPRAIQDLGERRVGIQIGRVLPENQLDDTVDGGCFLGVGSAPAEVAPSKGRVPLVGVFHVRLEANLDLVAFLMAV